MAWLTFLNPVILISLLIVPFIVYFYFKSIEKKRRATLKFSNIGLIKQATKKNYSFRKHLEFYMIASVIALMLIGFADPHIPLKQSKEGVNVVLSIDVSGSMQANDYKPTRLEAAKRSAIILIESLETKDNAGVVIFESGATTSAYLTPFKDKVVDKLKGIAPKEGMTAIGDGLSLAIDMASSIPNKKKVVILLSDGVSNAGVISPAEAIAFAKSNKIQVYTIGLGSEGQTILGYDFFGRPQYAELDEATLKSIAKETGGRYFKSVDDDTLNKIYKTISDEIEREEENTSIKDWFFVLSLLSLLSLLYIKYGKYRII